MKMVTEKQLLDLEDSLTDLRLYLERLEGHKIGGSIGYYLHQMSLGIFGLRIQIIRDPDLEFMREELKQYLFFLDQVKFMLYIGKRIRKPKKDPNQVLKEFSK